MGRKHQNITVTARRQVIWRIALTAALAALGWLVYQNAGYKYAVLAAGIGMIALLWQGKPERLGNLPSLLLLGYAALAMLAAFWALSGKFFLQRYSVIFLAAAVFLYVVLHGSEKSAFARRVMSVCAGISTIYAVLGVEAVSTGCFKALADKLFGKGAIEMIFSGRLYGAFGNSNIEASLYAIGMIFSIALICGTEEKRRRALWAAALAVNAYAMVLAMSIGAMASFAVAVAAYLIFAGEERGAALARMLCGALCGGAFAVVAGALANRVPPLLLVLLCCSAASATALESLWGLRLAETAQTRQKTVLGVLVGAVALVSIYLIVGLQIKAPTEIFISVDDPAGLAIRLPKGDHTLKLDADCDIRMSILTINRAQQLTNKWDVIKYSNSSEETFTVPKDSVEVDFLIYGRGGAGTLSSATVDGETELLYKYRILPSFIASRIQDPFGSTSFRQRQVYVQDALKLFRRRPVFGHGVGAFETAITSVQDFPYETKYVHNHYAQILVEGGVVGFALFAGSLIAMAVALWKSRRRMQGGEYAWLYPALCAEFVMNGLQMLWDVPMSVTVFLCMTYATYGMIVTLCAEPIGQKAALPEESAAKPKKKKKQARPAVDPLLIRLAAVTLPVLFVISVCLNLYANRLTHKEVNSFDDFETAAKIDLYEHNDWKLSYVIGAESEESKAHIDRANVYAAELSGVQSNSIPRYLVAYYLNTQQYAKAIDEAKLGATYSVSDPDVWNGAITSLKLMLIDTGAASPLLTQGDVLLPKLTEYREMLERYNETALVPVALNNDSTAFFDTVARLNGCAGDAEAMLAILTEPPAA